MNIERLAEIAKSVTDEFTKTGVINRIQGLSAALDQVMQQQSPEHEEALNTALMAFDKGMDESTLDKLPPTWRPYVEELKLHEVLGEPLRRRVVNIVEGRGVVQAKAKSELAAVVSDLSEFQKSFQQLIATAERFSFEAWHVEKGMAEVSFLFPSAQFDGRMAGFAKQVKFLDGAVGFFSELGTGSREEPKMYQLSNPDPFIVTGLTVAAASPLLLVVKEVLKVIEQTYSLRETRAKAIAAEASATTIQSIEADIQAKIDSGVIDTKALLFESYPPQKGRKHELDTEADKVLPVLADMIDRGYKIDADVEVQPEPEAAEDEELDQKLVEQIKLASDLVETARQIRYRDTPDEPVLKLAPPEPDDEDEDADG